jgi:hypothetical protein
MRASRLRQAICDRPQNLRDRLGIPFYFHHGQPRFCRSPSWIGTAGLHLTTAASCPVPSHPGRNISKRKPCAILPDFGKSEHGPDNQREQFVDRGGMLIDIPECSAIEPVRYDFHVGVGGSEMLPSAIENVGGAVADLIYAGCNPLVEIEPIP